MKRLYTLLLILFSAFNIMAQQADNIIGVWKNGEGTGHIEIYKTTSGHYAGKIIWLKEPIDEETGKPKLDKRNPDKSKINNPVLGLVNMHGFKFDTEDKEWIDGRIYDPKNGKDYACSIKMKDNTLRVRGYIGIKLIGRTDTWTRLK